MTTENGAGVCPRCPRGCPLDAPGCLRGEIYAQSLSSGAGPELGADFDAGPHGPHEHDPLQERTPEPHPHGHGTPPHPPGPHHGPRGHGHGHPDEAAPPLRGHGPHGPGRPGEDAPPPPHGPHGRGARPLPPEPEAPAAARSYQPKLTPPAGHPRLLLTPETIPAVRANLKHPENAQAVAVLRQLAAAPLQAPQKDGVTVYDRKRMKSADRRACAD